MQVFNYNTFNSPFLLHIYEVIFTQQHREVPGYAC